MKNLKLKAARALKDMSQDELAKKVEVSRQTINAIENFFRRRLVCPNMLIV